MATYGGQFTLTTIVASEKIWETKNLVLVDDFNNLSPDGFHQTITVTGYSCTV
ncbi:hypothetical protein O5585_22835 [Escherichia coli]|nr:hypothetical protein [Escherichia coli]MCZ5715561.1 hypothetical protein [Escherichia coli]